MLIAVCLITIAALIYYDTKSNNDNDPMIYA